MVLSFEPGSAQLGQRARANLDKAALWLQQNPDRTLVLIGHAGMEGPTFGNRAAAARDYLMARGIEAERISVVTVRDRSGVAQVRQPDRRIVYLLESDRPQAQPPQAQPPPVAQPRPAEPRTTSVTAVTIPAEREERRPETLGAGVGISIGGGVSNFVESEARRFTDVAGVWEGRITYGTRSPIAAELAYVGSAQDINALGLDDDAVLVSNGGEGVLRLNGGNLLNNARLTPYLFGGIGFSYYNIVNEDFNTSNIANNETVAYIPAGAGVSFSVARGVLFDVRGTIRPTFNNDLLRDEEGRDIDLHNWAATARLGFEF